MSCRSSQESSALEARWPSEKGSTNNNVATRHIGRHEPQRDKSANCSEESKQLEGNHNVITLSGGHK